MLVLMDMTNGLIMLYYFFITMFQFPYYIVIYFASYVIVNDLHCYNSLITEKKAKKV